MPNPSRNPNSPLLRAVLLACALGLSGCVPQRVLDAPLPRDSLEFLLAMSLESLLRVTFSTVPERARGPLHSSPHKPVPLGERP
jgi:hypothetical protein